MSIAAYQGVCPTCRYDHSADTLAPTTRETADHAELLAGKACGDRMLAVAEALMPWLKNYPPSTRRERAIEAANAAIAASSAPLLSEIAALRGERDRLAEELHNEIMVCAGKSCDADVAERQRDEAVGLLREWHPATSEAYRDHSLEARTETFLANQGADQ